MFTAEREVHFRLRHNGLFDLQKRPFHRLKWVFLQAKKAIFMSQQKRFYNGLIMR